MQLCTNEVEGICSRCGFLWLWCGSVAGSSCAMHGSRNQPMRGFGICSMDSLSVMDLKLIVSNLENLRQEGIRALKIEVVAASAYVIE